MSVFSVVVGLLIGGILTAGLIGAVVAIGQWTRVQKCDSRFRAKWVYAGQTMEHFEIVRCPEPRGHRGAHSTYILPATQYRSGSMAVAWSDEDSLDGPSPLPVPEAFKDALR